MSDKTLEEFFAEEEGQADVEDREALSRRKFLTGAVVGGAAGLAAAAGGGVAAWQVLDSEAASAREAVERELQTLKKAADAEVSRLQGLVSLYEGLEKVGLDAILQTGMVAVTLPLQAVEVGARALKTGLEWAEKALLSLQAALPTAEESLLWLEGRISALADGIHGLESAVGQALDRVSENSLVQALREFSRMILDNLPFGLGDRFRGVLDGVVGLVTSVDELVEGINTRLLEPLRTQWFSTGEKEGVRASFIDPLVQRVLDPLEAHLGSLSVLAETWQSDLLAPTEKALAEREQLREEIARYKAEHGLS